MLTAFRAGTFESVSIGFFDLSFILFIVSSIGYTTYLLKRTRPLWLIGFSNLVLGAFTMTLALALRWVAAGWHHPPWTNLYESLVFFSWGLIVCYAVMELRYEVKAVGAFVVPIVMMAMGLASLTGAKEITPLVPALQSVWLHIHVFGASIAYAMFMVAFGFAVLFLFRDGLPMPRFHFAVAVFNAVCVVAVTKLNVFSLSYPLTQYVDYGDELVKAMIPMTDPPEFYTLELPGLGAFLFVALLLFGASAVMAYRARNDGDGAPTRHSFYALVLPLIILGVALAHMVFQSGRYPAFSLRVNGYGFALLFLGWFFGIMTLVLHVSGDALRRVLPLAETLDDLVYKAVIFAFPILTFMLLSGAIWANQSWGRYWGWDPKETGALTTWIVYLAFLHLRISKGWTGRKSAYIAVGGFISVLFTYLGVNLVLSGLHSYGSA